MKCRHCGSEIPQGELRCAECGEEIRIVPDYNPLDEVLAAQVKGAFDGSKAPLDDYEYPVSENARNAQKTGNMRNTQKTGRTGNVTGKTRMTPEQRRKNAERRKALKKKKRIRMLIILGCVTVLAVALGIVLYQFSYKGQMNKGYKALESNAYDEAEDYFKKALKKNPKRGEAYLGLQKLYLEQDEAKKAEELLLEALEKYPDSPEIYEASFVFYIAIKEQGEIPVLLDAASEEVQEALAGYECETPEFSLADDEVYDDVQQLSLKTSEDKIYYTTDESDPFYSNTRIQYTKPIQISEGETVIKAVAVNDEGIPSLMTAKTYIVEFPIEDAPAVTPSTGQYDAATKISIIVPDGYKAYYTMDESNPTEESFLYTEPVDMPEGTTIFKAVLVSADGRLSGVTTRNYELLVE